MKLSQATQKFILHWGEMGTRWGINRTVAQIHALLYVSPQPLNAEEITETLTLARSNVSNSLRELQTWGLVKIVHLFGDRRDHFESLKDVWEMFRLVLDQRKKREVDPTVTLLRECMANLEKNEPADAYTKQRLSEMLEFFESSMNYYEDIHRLPSSSWKKLAKISGKVQKLLGFIGSKK